MIPCHANGVTGAGPHDAEVMFVGIAPGRDEWRRTKQPFTGESGKLLNASLAAVGVDRDDCYATNLICWWKDDPTKEEIDRCGARLSAEIMWVKPKVIVALGALAVERLTGRKFSQAQSACVWSEEFDCWVVCSYHPAAIFRAPARIADLIRDFNKINFIKDQPREFGHVDWSLVASIDDAQTILDSEWAQNAQFLANDVETKYDEINDRYTTDIRCLGISDGDKTFVFTEPVVEGVRWPIERNWTFHNGIFDTRIIISDLGVELPVRHDTLLMSYSLDERGGSDDEGPLDIAVGIHGLKKLSREYVGGDFYDINTRTATNEELYPYNAKDAAYTARLAKHFYPRMLLDGRTYEVYSNLTLPQVPMARDEFMHGIYVHREELRDLAISWMEEWKQLDSELMHDAQYWYGWPRDDFNFNSTKQLKKFLNDYLDLNVPNTQADTLKQHIDHPWIAKQQRLKRIDKQLGTYVLGTSKTLWEDGRSHPEPSLHGTMSGRYTYHNPSINTSPTGAQYIDPDEEPDDETAAIINEFSRVRGLYGAPEGMKYVEADYEAAELWTAAYYSDDDVMLRDLLSGDFHSRASEKMFRVRREDYSPEHWKSIRRNSKYVTFGVLFLRGAKSLYNPKAGQGGNLGKFYTLREIEEMVRNWHKEYAKHMRWANEQVRLVRETGEQENIAGRRRRYHLPDLYGPHFASMVVNYPIQSTAHDHLIAARLELYDTWKRGELPGHMLWDGHDAIHLECPEPNVQEQYEIVKYVMEKPRWFSRGIPVEIKVGTSWRDGKVYPPTR